MQPIDLNTAQRLIDFSGGREELSGLGAQQLQGSLALHNKLAQHRVAYLADEVGMGKTYVALGVVALMRRFNPDLRVLYLLPSVNVRDKWLKDFHSFIEHNYRNADIIVRGIGDVAEPAAPQVTCDNLADLVHALASSTARDYFICTSAFSFALGATAGELEASLDRLVKLLPQSRNDEQILSLRQRLKRCRDDSDVEALKESVKQCWAAAIYRVLPSFDLVLVDEAHNLRKSGDSSARNRMLSTALLGQEGEVSRIRRLLLLSATPYDRDLSHLRNQLALFGMTQAAALPGRAELHSKEMQEALHRLMVRRLNELHLDEVPHTRNMYRHELRTGDEAEVKMGVAEQLFSALVQKRVSQHLQQNFAGRFELGMLASFESYLPGQVQFDGDLQETSVSDNTQPDARDQNVVQQLVSSWWSTFDHRLPPHPKMTWVSNQLARLAFDEGSKQLVFVRRVSSVSELKGKLDEAYDDWLVRQLASDEAVMAWFERYRTQHCERSGDVTSEEADENGEPSARSDNFFTWFYRGRNTELNEQLPPALGTLPSSFRNMLSRTSCLFECGWNRLPGMPNNLVVDWSRWIVSSSDKPSAQRRFRVAQYAWLQTVVMACEGTNAASVADRILRYAYPDWSINEPPGIELTDLSSLQNDLDRFTLWDELRQRPGLELAPVWSLTTFELLSGDVNRALHELKRQLIHMELLALACRLDHPFIDLYSLRAVRRDEGNADDALRKAFGDLLARQAEQQEQFCSWQILHDIATNLDLLVKLNFPAAWQKTSAELTRYLSNQISPLQPIAGASGANRAERSPLARRFRMPGYPRVLVSTDVFQEGEDLHTFCDSVMHYGIPRSPIALEQKVGRVDRVASLAHRRMLANQKDSARHFIKVRYPHIRQSLEFLQVRESARSLNDFMLSLGRAQVAGGNERELQITEQLSDTSPVQPPLRDHLTSLFPVQPDDLKGSNQLAVIEKDLASLNERLQHIHQQITAILGKSPEDRPSHWRTDDTQLDLRTIAGHPELLLSASREYEAAPGWLVENCRGWASKRIERLQELQSNPLHRLQLHHSRDQGWLLRANCEIYAGSQRILQSEELRYLLARVRGDSAAGSQADSRSRLECMLANLPCPDGVKVLRSSSQVLCYEFERQGRTQRVRVSVGHGHVKLSSRVLDALATEELARGCDSFWDSALVRYTLRRNTGFDLVDFHVNRQGELAVRACHPLQWLNSEELGCMGLLVAAEADRLEHIIRGGGDHE